MRTIEAMQRQLLGLIGRAVVKSISAATKCQTVDVSLIAGEPKAGVGVLRVPIACSTAGAVGNADDGTALILVTGNTAISCLHQRTISPLQKMSW